MEQAVTLNAAPLLDFEVVFSDDPNDGDDFFITVNGACQPKDCDSYWIDANGCFVFRQGAGEIITMPIPAELRPKIDAVKDIMIAKIRNGKVIDAAIVPFLAETFH